MTLTIERLGHQGDGIAPGPVFVPMTLPGEVVEAEVSGGRATSVRIVTPSVDRVKPLCRHYRSCGGCIVQHASEPLVAAWKQDQVRAALAAQGLEAPIRALHVSPPNSRRRATLAGRRTKSGALVGFHGRASATLTEVPDCKVLAPELLAALPALERVTMMAASRKTEVGLTLTLTETGLDLVISDAKPFEPSEIAALMQAIGRDFARVTWNGEVVAQDRLPMVRLGKAFVPMPPGAFLQATVEGEAALLRGVEEITAEAGRIADLFCGIGTFALPLTRRAEVLAVEGEAPMVDAMVRGWREAAGLHQLTAERRDLFRRPLSGDELRKLDAVVLDPPRAGAEAQAVDLAASAVPLIAYVSCSPSSFARDVRILVDGGYRLEWIEVVDQFRWSSHVELVAKLTRA